MYVDKYEIKKRALLEAIRFVGSVTGLAKQIGAKRSQVNNWLNRDDAIPYQYAILTEEITGVSTERLAPDETATNKVMRRLRNSDGNKTVNIPIKNIAVTDSQQEQMPLSQDKDALAKPIIVTADLNLIAGLARLEARKASGHSTISAIVVDTEALLLGVRLINELNGLITISDQVFVAINIENQLGNRKGRRKCSHLSGKTDDIAAKLAGFSSRDSYRRAKKVIQLGIPTLIAAMDNKSISISLAAKIATASHQEQIDFLRERQT